MQRLMVIIANYAIAEESYGLLGPQMAATIIQKNTDYDCIVVAVGHNFNKDALKKYLLNLVKSEKPVIGFSHLGGRQDLIDLAKELKEEGVVTILGGPQADVDFQGELDWEKQEHRYSGLRHAFNYAIQGPAESIIPLLNTIHKPDLSSISGLTYINADKYQFNARLKWNEGYLKDVNWDNLYLFDESGLKQIKVTLGQVIQQIGCPYAAKSQTLEIDYPIDLNEKPFNKKGKISLDLRGCSFCDVARDKGYAGKLSMESVLVQISNLPEGEDHRKIPFELINEQAVSSLSQLLTAVKEQKIRISQINLVTRADWLYQNEEDIKTGLELADLMNIKILLSQVGFESFSDTILRNLNKGYSFDTNLRAIRLARRLKQEYPNNWFYSTSDGAYHGFINPTPWDSKDTISEMNFNISFHGINLDILPPHNTPLLIHHACGLGDWAREFEKREGIKLLRAGSLIIW